MRKWVTVNMETEHFDFDVDVALDIEVNEPIKVDVGVGPGMVVDPGGTYVNVLAVEMNGRLMPPAFVKLVEKNIEDLIDEEDLELGTWR